MTAVLLALAASASWGVSDFLGGLTSRRTSLATVLAITTPLGLVVIGAVVAARDEPLPATSFILWAALSGVLAAVGIASLYQGLSIGQMGVVAPLSATAPLIPIVFGLVRGDRPSNVQAAGIALALVGMVLTSRERDTASGGGRRLATGAAFGLLAAAAFGVSLISLDEAADADPYWATLILRSASSVAVLVVILVLRRPVSAPRRFWPALVLVATLDAGGTLLFSLSTTKGLISIVSAVIAFIPVFVALLARVFLHERLERIQVAGVALAVAGVAFISAG